MKISLCADAGNQFCPILDIQTDKVMIGEEGNLVRLTIPQWNKLVEEVKKL